MLDKKAVKILLSTYWSSSGWKQNHEVSAEDFAYAKWAGVMFDPISQSHDRAVSHARDAVRAATRSAAVDAFVASLSTRRLDLRSALGSFAIGQHLPDHTFEEKGACPECGGYEWSTPVDLNVLNFERIKWGGVRHSHPEYIAFDLEQLGRSERPEPSEEDVAALAAIVDIAASMPADARPRDLERRIGKVIKSNKAEREILIQILGYCGVLEPSDYPSFRDQFVRARDRAIPAVSKIDWQYPACWWRGSDGVNSEAAEEWFSARLR